jgi:hypothetical protein
VSLTRCRRCDGWWLGPASKHSNASEIAIAHGYRRMHKQALRTKGGGGSVAVAAGGLVVSPGAAAHDVSALAGAAAHDASALAGFATATAGIFFVRGFVARSAAAFACASSEFASVSDSEISASSVASPDNDTKH